MIVQQPQFVPTSSLGSKQAKSMHFFNPASHFIYKIWKSLLIQIAAGDLLHCRHDSGSVEILLYTLVFITIGLAMFCTKEFNKHHYMLL